MNGKGKNIFVSSFLSMVMQSGFHFILKNAIKFEQIIQSPIIKLTSADQLIDILLYIEGSILHFDPNFESKSTILADEGKIANNSFMMEKWYGENIYLLIA